MSEQQQPSSSTLTREIILRALSSLSDALGQQGVTGEVCLFGGTVMVLAFTARLTTKDVDALFQPTPLIHELARRIADDRSERKRREWFFELLRRHSQVRGVNIYIRNR